MKSVSKRVHYNVMGVLSYETSTACRNSHIWNAIRNDILWSNYNLLMQFRDLILENHEENQLI